MISNKYHLYIRNSDFVQSLKILKMDSSEFIDFVDSGVDQSLLSDFVLSGHKKKLPGPSSLSDSDIVDIFLKFGALVSGGSAASRYFSLPSRPDIDIFFNNKIDFLNALLLSRYNPNIDVCLYENSPYELFDLSVCQISYDRNFDFSLHPSFQEFVDTGISRINTDCIFHPVATLRRMIKYGNLLKAKFSRDDFIQFVSYFDISNRSLLDEASNFVQSSNIQL